ncbi:imidazolonepropionase [Planctomycetes bacterium Poly30]|uniref:Imidazolonepropionase n=1 Tax=Saltatorellus ferox TaxID=2528018 RepID=A0A518EYF9_9BACT|nr:imidazolonepropionase [Planctomycetes bacterium Poly30]
MRTSYQRPQAAIAPTFRGAASALAATAALAMAALHLGGNAQAGQEAGSDAEPVRSQALFLTAKRLIVSPGNVLENASVLVEDGKITAVGTDLKAPEGAQAIQGEVICAAFMDPWSTAGFDTGSVNSRDLNAATMATDALDPYGEKAVLEELAASGVLLTRSQVGLASDISGFGAVLRTPSAEVVLEDASMSAAIGAESPGFSPDQFGGRGGPQGFSFGPQSIDPIDRIGQIDKLVSELAAGQKYAEDMAEYEKELAEWKAAIADKEKELEDDFKKAKKAREKAVKDAEEDGEEVKEKKYKEDRRPREPRYDAEKAAFARVVQGEVPMVVHAERALEIRDLLRSTEPFKRLRLVIAGGTSALACKKELRERGVTVIVAPSPANPGGPVGELDPGLSLAAELDAAGVNVLIGTGNASALASRDLPLLAALAVGHGLDRDTALRAITSGPAATFDVADQVGTVKRGHAADLLVLSGDPLSSSSRVLAAISGGAVVPQATK